MISQVRAWLNSLQAHMIGFAFSVIILLTLIGFVVVRYAAGPLPAPVSMYDLSRVIRGAEAAHLGLRGEVKTTERLTIPAPATPVEFRLAKVLSEDLQVPAQNVRIYLGNRSPTYFDYVARQLDLYDRDGRASPLVSGDVVAAVKLPDGRWREFSRKSRDGFNDVWTLLRPSPWLGALVLIPFSMWFSTRLARPVRAFAEAASRVGDGRQQFPVPVVGPNETRIAALALNEMQARIRDFMRERTALVGAIAHDLRTPLNNLRFRIAGAPAEIRRAAEADILQLDQLISSIMDYVENDGRALSIDTVDLTSLLQSLADDKEDLGRNVSFTGDRVQVEGDIVMLRRLFSNLIDNACKFASGVVLTLSATPSHAHVEILDNGPGMPPDDLDRAFEPFFRGESSRNRETGGIGLGLSIARSIAEAHAGTLTLQNGPDGGLLARVVLPLKRSM